MKIYLAGMESILTSYKSFDLKSDDNIFGTFFYENNTTKMLQVLKDRGGHQGIVTIDSGAHSFFGYAGTSSATHQQNKDKSKMPDPHEYMARYVKWIKANWDMISFFVELDIQAIVGLEQVKKWRNLLKKEGLYSKCITVYHSVDKFDDYMEMLETSESGYVGLEGLRNRVAHVPYIKSLKEAYSRGIKVHGFALTDVNVMRTYPFYSVDSTTWTSGVRYGTFMAIDKDHILAQKGPSKENYFKHNIPVEQLSKQKGPESSTLKLQHAADKFRRMQGHITDLWEARGVHWQD